jgi:hypothetical protein
MWRAWVAVFAIGCLGHTTLPVPPPTLTAEQRVLWFNSLAGRTEQTTWTFQTRTGFVSDIQKTMTLANGTEIEAPEDVLPVVAPDSATARHARAALEEREHGDRWREVAVGVLVGALVISTARNTSNPFEDRWDAAIWGSAAAFGLFSSIASGDSYRHAARQAGFAFESYTKDLADRLQICVLNMQLVPCEYRAPAPAAPAAPPEPTPPPVPAGRSVPDGPVAGR